MGTLQPPAPLENLLKLMTHLSRRMDHLVDNAEDDKREQAAQHGANSAKLSSIEAEQAQQRGLIQKLTDAMGEEGALSAQITKLAESFNNLKADLAGLKGEKTGSEKTSKTWADWLKWLGGFLIGFLLTVITRKLLK